MREQKMGLKSIVDRFLRSGPPTEEAVGTITFLKIDPQGDGKSATFRMDTMPNMEFRQRPNTLTSVHRPGERVKVVYSVVKPGVATVDWIETR
jgi:hypothetical protein